ncbi:hypothetical protein [Rhodopirellula halodulae]|uniref:hypothetical protein n=1 Tax=Rhodopirellula halodulae TaxID=2894198 RepID=UPI001E4C62DA|nr:hypothetical protein [Rhodopirellula sp. JC737]MCC9655296.1 hypothetical protein [Rhodopirellula sp. JC737]
MATAADVRIVTKRRKKQRIGIWDVLNYAAFALLHVVTIPVIIWAAQEPEQFRVVFKQILEANGLG